MTVFEMVKRMLIAACAAGLALAGAAAAEAERSVPAAATQTRATQTRGTQTRGPVTNLPLPRFVSLKTDKGNARRGPSMTHRIDWVFTRRGMPLQVTAEYGHWRRVRDHDGQGGWVHYALLSGVRTVLVEQDMLTAHARPDPKSPAVAAFELGVVARLGDCTPGWCEISASGYRGWVPKTALWGVAPNEIRH